MMPLRDYQHVIVDYILQNARCNLFVPMGMGKTISVLTAIDILSLVEDIFPVLVIAPLRVASSTWPDEVKKWPHLQHLRVSVVTGAEIERRKALTSAADIYSINYDNLVWLDELLGDTWPFRMVVADECTRLKSFRLRQGSVRAQALAKHAHDKTPRYIGLTGTPASNGLQDLWAIAWFVDKGERLGKSFQAFKNRWFQSISMGGGFQKITPLPHAREQIEEKLKDICLSLDARDYFNLADPITNVVEIELPEKARRAYDAMEKEFFMSLEGSDFEAVNAAARTQKCLQLASGAIYKDTQVDGDNNPGSREFFSVHDAKLQALDSIIEEANGAPVLVAYHFKSDLTRLLKKFPRGRALDANPQTIKDWNAGKIPVLFAHPASAGHGLNLQDGGNILVFFSHWWDLEQYQQIVERIGPTRQAQAGHNRPVFIYHIVARGTLDEVVMERRESKRTLQDLLMNAMKHRRHAA